MANKYTTDAVRTGTQQGRTERPVPHKFVPRHSPASRRRKTLAMRLGIPLVITISSLIAINLTTPIFNERYWSYVFILTYSLSVYIHVRLLSWPPSEWTLFRNWERLRLHNDSEPRSFTGEDSFSRTLWKRGVSACCTVIAFVPFAPWIMRYGRRATSRVADELKNLLITTGYLEPPLKHGQVRIRRQCGCGERFILDYSAFKSEFAQDYAARGIIQFIVDDHAIPGVAKYALRSKMFGLRLIDGQETSQSSLESNSQKIVLPRPWVWLNRVLARLNTMLREPLEQSTLPQHSANTTTTHSPQGTPIQPPQLIHLLTCLRSAKLGKGLHQICIDAIKTDRQLFDFLRELYKSKRGQIRTLFSLKAVKGIHVVRLNLFAGGAVEVRHHKECCNQDCTCIPPASLVQPSDNAEYQCYPAGPLKYGPPIPPEVLAHFYSSPSCIPDPVRSVLDRLPIRIIGELQKPTGEPAEGWGIYFHEGWDGDIITLLVFVMFLAGSLIFGILWSYLKMDVQGAFGVSAYILTAGAILVSLVAMKANKI
ncbi:hypothetical protein P171DRAFT_410588 [Karstenula rhodostoma CBS 690.94]|uniref:Transmembrane protein n=1 Tax=Karstenula rhodostoma CBS 690.94 TaxID=1392251 RepID=A0A9P4PNI6_9PLEO|nr:hypothetical protein P171DRAFT_410588 [Karstenula rhodostoma CBS 690.94]